MDFTKRYGVERGCCGHASGGIPNPGSPRGDGKAGKAGTAGKLGAARCRPWLAPLP